MQAFSAKLHTLYQRLTSISSALQLLDNTAERDIRSEMRQQVSDSYFPDPYDGKLVLFRATERDPFEECDRDMAGQSWRLAVCRFLMCPATTSVFSEFQMSK